MGRDLLPWSGLIMGVSSLRLEPRFGGVFSWPSSMLGGIVGNRRERLGESAERGSAQARGPRSRRAPGPRRAPPISTISTGRGRVFREPSPHRSVGASAYRVGVGAMAVVLIVEDEEQVRVLAEAIIRELGHDTLTAGTAEQAGALRRRPALHRYRPAARHRSRAAARAGCGGAQAGAAPVLYTTGQGVTDGMRAMFAEPFGFVPKPYTPDALKTALSNLLSQGLAASRRVNGTGSADPSGRREGVAG